MSSPRRIVGPPFRLLFFKRARKKCNECWIAIEEESSSRNLNLFEKETANCSCIRGFCRDATEYLGVLEFAQVVLSVSEKVGMSIQ